MTVNLALPKIKNYGVAIYNIGGKARMGPLERFCKNLESGKKLNIESISELFQAVANDSATYSTSLNHQVSIPITLNTSEREACPLNEAIAYVINTINPVEGFSTSSIGDLSSTEKVSPSGERDCKNIAKSASILDQGLITLNWAYKVQNKMLTENVSYRGIWGSVVSTINNMRSGVSAIVRNLDSHIQEFILKHIQGTGNENYDGLADEIKNDKEKTFIRGLGFNKV